VTTSAADHHSLIVRALENGGGLKQLESNAYDAALAKTRGNVSAAARLLGITRAQLDYRLGKRRSGSRKRLARASLITLMYSIKRPTDFKRKLRALNGICSHVRLLGH
jgi:hypothetical protein